MNKIILSLLLACLPCFGSGGGPINAASQAQVDSKAPINDPTFTGEAIFPDLAISNTGTIGDKIKWSTDGSGNIGVGNSDGSGADNRPENTFLKHQVFVGNSSNFFEDSSSQILLGTGSSLAYMASKEESGNVIQSFGFGANAFNYWDLEYHEGEGDVDGDLVLRASPGSASDRFFKFKTTEKSFYFLSGHTGRIGYSSNDYASNFSGWEFGTDGYVYLKNFSTQTMRFDPATGNARINGNVSINTAGKGLQVKTGTNQMAGTAVLVAGTVTVTNTAVTSSTICLATVKVLSGIAAPVGVMCSISAGASITITSASVLDTSTISYLLVEAN